LKEILGDDDGGEGGLTEDAGNLSVGGHRRNRQGHFSFELGERLQRARRGEGIGQKGGDVAAWIPGQSILYMQDAWRGGGDDPFGSQERNPYYMVVCGKLVEIAGGESHPMVGRIHPYPGITVEVAVGDRPRRRDAGIIDYLCLTLSFNQITRSGTIDPGLIVFHIVQNRAKLVVGARQIKYRL